MDKNSISENLRSKVKRSRSPHDQVWTKIQFWSHNFIPLYQTESSFKKKRLVGAVLSISKKSGPKIKGQVHHMTKYGQNYSFGSLTPFICVRWQLLSMEKAFGALLSIFKILRSKGQGHRMTKCGQNHSFGSMNPFT